MTTARERSALPPATELEYLARVYRRFADEEARGRPPLYVHLAGAVAGDEQVLARIATLPKPKQQPNLLFAAVRSLFGTPPDFPSFRADLIAGWPRLAEIILARSTQTNEPARCATLLPILSALPGPLALIEVGAAAGLCLLPDLYAYNYGGTTIAPERSDPARPTFTCTLSGPAAVPTRLPKIAWRAGLDLDPINLDDQARVASKARTRFSQLGAAGLTMTIFFYVTVNLMMVMGLAPVVGIPLPLVSFGGSAVMTVMICLGLLKGIERQQRTRSTMAIVPSRRLHTGIWAVARDCMVRASLARVLLVWAAAGTVSAPAPMTVPRLARVRIMI